MVTRVKNPPIGVVFEDGEVVGLKVNDQQYDIFNGYESFPNQTACPASATTNLVGTINGAGDVVGKLDVIVNTAGATATLSIQDGTTGTTFQLSPTGGFPTVGIFEVWLGYKSKIGAWRVIAGAGVQVIGSVK